MESKYRKDKQGAFAKIRERGAIALEYADAEDQHPTYCGAHQ